VVNLSTTNQAHYAGKVVGKADFIAPLTAAKGVAKKLGKGTGIEIRCRDPRVPADESNTCYRVADRVLKKLKQRGKLVISIEKNLPVQGGLGAGSSNAVATMLALEKELKFQLSPVERFSQHIRLPTS